MPVERVWDGLPEVNRQTVVWQLAKLAGHAMTASPVTAERDRP